MDGFGSHKVHVVATRNDPLSSSICNRITSQIYLGFGTHLPPPLTRGSRRNARRLIAMELNFPVWNPVHHLAAGRGDYQITGRLEKKKGLISK